MKHETRLMAKAEGQYPGRFVVLRDLGDGHNPYVTHIWFDGTYAPEGYVWGNYFDNPADAMQDFVDRLQKEINIQKEMSRV